MKSGCPKPASCWQLLKKMFYVYRGVSSKCHFLGPSSLGAFPVCKFPQTWKDTKASTLHSLLSPALGLPALPNQCLPLTFRQRTCPQACHSTLPSRPPLERSCGSSQHSQPDPQSWKLNGPVSGFLPLGLPNLACGSDLDLLPYWIACDIQVLLYLRAASLSC